LIAQALAATGGHDAEAILPREDRFDHLPLPGPERLQPEVGEVRFERLVERRRHSAALYDGQVNKYTRVMPHPFEPPSRKVGVVGVLVRENRLLVIKRSQLVRAPGRYCFPGGGMEPGESEEQTLVREMQEELGVSVQPIRRLYRSLTPWRVDLRWWLAATDDDAVFVPHPAEIESHYWHSVAELLAIEALLESNRDFLAAWQRGEFEIDGLPRY
jgi:8-oxo-dGTP pyrophosphatase MutT (NUDIX family)